MSYLKKIFLVLLLLFLAFEASATTYYVDFVSGIDSNNGTSTSTPWKHHPWMTGATSTSAAHAHAAGERYVFKGGVTWDHTCFPWTVEAFDWTKNAATYDYWGVDVTWFTGGAFARPIFNGNGISAGILEFQYANFITLDNLEFQNIVCNAFDQCMISLYSTTDITITNCYVHKWTHTGSTDNLWGGIIVNNLGNNYSISNIVVTHCEIGNSDGDGNSGCCLYLVGEVAFCKIHDAPDGLLHGGYSVHDNEFYNISASFDAAAHNNVMYIHIWNGGRATYSPALIYNNYIHDSPNAAEYIYLNSSATGYNNQFYVYNNVVIDNQGQETINTDNLETPAGQTGNSKIRIFVWNNTIQNTLNGGSVFVPSSRTGLENTTQLSWWNNVIIGPGTGIGLTGVASYDSGSNFVYASAAAANSAGIYSGDYWAPTNGSLVFIRGGTNLNATNITVLHLDTSRGNYRTPIDRPGNGTNYDAGAYQFLAGGSVWPWGMWIINH